MFRRAVGSLLARRFSPRAATPSPRTAPARSLHSSLRDVPIDDVIDGALIFAAATGTAAAGTVVLRYYTRGPAGEMIRKPDMEERFEQFIMNNDKKYRDEEEKAMRFQVFKATVEWMESQPLDVQKRMFQGINYFADYTKEERQWLLAFPDPEAPYECPPPGEYMRGEYKQADKQADKQVDKQATQAAA